MSKVKSIRNKTVIAVDGFMYIYDKSNVDKTKRYWRCRRKDLFCPARIHTGYDDYDVLKTSAKTHCHDSEVARIEVDAALTEMRERAILSAEPMSSIIDECVNGLSDAAKGVLQSSAALKKQVRRIRNSEKTVCLLDPLDLVSLQMPDDTNKDELQSYSPSISDKTNCVKVHGSESKWKNAQDNYKYICPTTSIVPSDLNKEDVKTTNLSDNIANCDASLINNDNISNIKNIENISHPSLYNVIKETNFEEKLTLILNSIQQSCIEQIRRINRDTDDEDLNFYVSTLPIIKTLNMDQKIQFRIQLMKLLQNIYNKPNQ